MKSRFLYDLLATISESSCQKSGLVVTYFAKLTIVYISGWRSNSTWQKENTVCVAYDFHSNFTKATIYDISRSVLTLTQFVNVQSLVRLWLLAKSGHLFSPRLFHNCCFNAVMFSLSSYTRAPFGNTRWLEVKRKLVKR